MAGSQNTTYCRTIYNRETNVFERTDRIPSPVGTDILRNGLGCRQTKAE